MSKAVAKEVRRRWFFIDIHRSLTWRDLPSGWARKEVLKYLKEKKVYKSDLQKDRLIYLC